MSSTKAPEKLHKKLHDPHKREIGHRVDRSPCLAIGESLWSDNSLDHGKPPLRINRENLHDLQPGTSITVPSNWRNSVVQNSLDHGNLPLYHTRRNVQKASWTDAALYPLSNQRVLNTEIIPEVISQKIHTSYSSGDAPNK